MQRANLMEQEGNDATIAAVARTMDLPLDLRQPPPTASYQAYFAVFIDWLRATWRRERRRRDLAAMRDWNFVDPTVSPSPVIDEFAALTLAKIEPSTGRDPAQTTGAQPPTSNDKEGER
jgi:hypothetical protein